MKLKSEQPWFRHHDRAGSPHGNRHKVVAHDASLNDLIGLCGGPGTDALHAAGSHWSLSESSRSDHTLIETHAHDGSEPAMGRTLNDVIPACMDSDFLELMGSIRPATFSLIHVEAGKRIYQAYSELDQVDPLTSDKTLGGFLKIHHQNDGYKGPWGFGTLGGAGGQTIVGALSTGTHGGDFDRPPVADWVAAIHLVVDGGKHYWIERESAQRLADHDKLKALYDRPQLGGPGRFEIKRDDDLFNAVLVSAGRFGVIYSVVLVVLPQYSLYERRVLLPDWADVKGFIKDRTSGLYTASALPTGPGFTPSSTRFGPCRFLQIVVSVTPYSNSRRNRVGITQRWQLPLPPNPAGRAERRGEIEVSDDPQIHGPRFTKAGRSHSYHPPDRPNEPPEPSFLESACANASFLRGVLQKVIRELDELVREDGRVVGPIIAAVAVLGGTGLLILLGAFVGLVVLLERFLREFDDRTPLGAHINNLKNLLLDPPISDPLSKQAGLFTWQMIAYEIFESQQDNREIEAISYAIMDAHDYKNVGCEVNGDSIEVFFNAVDDRMVTFVDLVLAFEKRQELRGLAFAGYLSLRFSGPSGALLGMQQWPTSCSIEIAGLKNVSGSQELIDYASRVALNPNIGGVIHWGQHNDCTPADTARLFSNSIARWRRQLAALTDNGRLHRFSSQFTRRTGLEVVIPLLREFRVTPPELRVGEPATVTWDASDNPPGTTVALTLINAGGRRRLGEEQALTGSYSFVADEPGEHAIGIEVTTPTGGPDAALRTGAVVSATPYEEAR